MSKTTVLFPISLFVIGGYAERRLTGNAPSTRVHVRDVGECSQKEKQHMMTYRRFQRGVIGVLGSALLVMGAAVVGVGCEREGSVERAGKKVDQVVEEAMDKLNPEGPVERAGKKVDQAVEDATDKATDR